MQFFRVKNKAIGLFTILRHATLKWGSFSCIKGWTLKDDMVFFSVFFSIWCFLPAPQHVPCRVCSLFSVTPLGTGSLGFKGHPSAAFEMQQPLCNHDTGLRQWRRRSQRWQRKNKVTKERWSNNVFYVCICTFNNSGIWLTSWSLHFFFFSINLKV